MGVKDLIRKMEQLAADTSGESGKEAAPSDKTAAPATQSAEGKPVQAASVLAGQPATDTASSGPAANGYAKENGAQLHADAAPGKEPEDPEKKAKKV